MTVVPGLAPAVLASSSSLISAPLQQRSATPLASAEHRRESCGEEEISGSKLMKLQR